MKRARDESDATLIGEPDVIALPDNHKEREGRDESGGGGGGGGRDYLVDFGVWSNDAIEPSVSFVADIKFGVDKSGFELKKPESGPLSQWGIIISGGENRPPGASRAASYSGSAITITPIKQNERDTKALTDF